MAEGNAPQPIGISPIFLGELNDLNISNRKDGTIYIGGYVKNSNGSPDSNTGGWFILFVNFGNSLYGRQLAVGDAGFWTRTLFGGSYTAWTKLA